jgi:hypothetical protein
VLKQLIEIALERYENGTLKKEDLEETLKILNKALEKKN